jgi:DNA-binding CsgD family transcriptional regulator/catechol 2,3-dioxygenase-like lactoylglutathione lyase family enzyme
MARGRGRPPHPDVLTPAEWEVLDWIRHGISRREIAKHRGTSRDAIRYHVRNIVGKLGARNSAHLRHWPGYPSSSPLARRRSASMIQTVTLGSIGQISLLTRNIPAAEAFYRDTLGLPLIFNFGNVTFFDASGIRLFLRVVPDEEWRPSSILYFRVDDVHDAYDALKKKGVNFQGAPHLIHRHDDGTEEWMAFFEDPDRNVLALMSQVPPVHAEASDE